MLPLIIYGGQTCEDTALVRAHLWALGIPFTERDVEDAPEARAVIERWNNGQVVTPTLIFGNDQIVMSEPALEQLDEALHQAGYEFKLPRAVEFPELALLPAPDFTLQASDGGEVQLSRLRGRNKAVLFFAHAADCRVCQGYARQLTNHPGEFAEYESALFLIVPGNVEIASVWADAFARGYAALADEGGEVKQKYAEYFHASVPSADAHGVFVLILDQYTAPRAGSFAADAGGLITPREILDWLHLLDSECAE